MTRSPYSPAQAVAIALLNCRVTRELDTGVGRDVVNNLQGMGWRLADEGGPVVQPGLPSVVRALVAAEGATAAEVDRVIERLMFARVPDDPADVRAQVRDALRAVRVVCDYCDGNGPPDKGGHVPCRGCGGSATPGLVPA